MAEPKPELKELQFPLEYIAKMPTVSFFPRSYTFPTADSKSAAGKVVRSGEVPAITLYLPGGYTESLSSNWEMQDVLGGTSSSLIGGAFAELAKLAADKVGAKIKSTIMSRAGYALSPTDVLIFNGTEPIVLSFAFEMIPASKAEATVINNIVKSFKKATLPKSNLAQSVLKYPLIWDIHFNYGKEDIGTIGLENPSEYRHMALVNLDVKFSGNETSFMVYRDGNPVQVTLTLQFKSIMRHFTTDTTIKSEDVVYNEALSVQPFSNYSSRN